MFVRLFHVSLLLFRRVIWKALTRTISINYIGSMYNWLYIFTFELLCCAFVADTKDTLFLISFQILLSLFLSLSLCNIYNLSIIYSPVTIIVYSECSFKSHFFLANHHHRIFFSLLLLLHTICQGLLFVRVIEVYSIRL